MQVACVYGDLTGKLTRRVAAGGGPLISPMCCRYNWINSATSCHQRAGALAGYGFRRPRLPDASYDRALLFFLLHEQPALHRQRTLGEVFRVVNPGGKIVIIDYAHPHWWHPLRYLWRPLLAALEPFALDLWPHEIAHWLPAAARDGWRKQSFFGGLYQKVVIKR